MKKMNKKLALLLIPLMVIPMASFAYAHFYDYVTKQYKIHVGSIEAKVEYFNVTSLLYNDIVGCGHRSGVYGDEIKIGIGETDCTWYVNITIDPAIPGMIMESEMLIHNIGKLPWRIESPAIVWDGPHAADPCFNPNIVNATPLPNWIKITWSYWKHDASHDPKGCFDPKHYTVPADPTQYPYCNCSSVLVKQRLWLSQALMEPIQKEIECNWWRIVLKFRVKSEDPTTITEPFVWWNP